MKSNARSVAKLRILSILLSLEDKLTHIASCVEKNRFAALWVRPLFTCSVLAVIGLNAPAQMLAIVKKSPTKHLCLRD